MTILVADKLETSALEGLRSLGANVVSEPDLKDDALEARIKALAPAILVVRGTKVTKPMLEGSELELVVRAGAGYNTIDVEAADNSGVAVANCPGKNAIAVAELTFGLIIALDRFIPDNVDSLRQGFWNKKAFSKAKGLAGRTIGLVGLGAIGSAVAFRANAFDMNVLSYSLHTSQDDADAFGATLVTLEELARESDIVSLHCALTESTRGLVGEQFFRWMKPGAMLINTSRAEVVDQKALLAACESKGIRAGLDVFEGEPTVAEGTYEGPLKTAGSVYCTHHIGASTEQAQEAVADEVVRIVAEFMSTGEVLNEVG